MCPCDVSSHLCKVFIETLLERADRAEQQLFILSSHSHRKCMHTRHHGGFAPVSGWVGRSLDGSADDIITDRLETLGNRVREIKNEERMVVVFIQYKTECKVNLQIKLNYQCLPWSLFQRSFSISGSCRLGEPLCHRR